MRIEDRYYRVEEVACLAQFTPTHLYRLIRAGVIEVTHPYGGRPVRIRPEEVARFLGAGIEIVPVGTSAEPTKDAQPAASSRVRLRGRRRKPNPRAKGERRQNALV